MKAKATFRKLIQDSQEYGSDNDHMISRGIFDLEIDGKQYRDLYVDIKETVGGDSKSGPIEVGPPYGYTGPLNYNAFRKAAEEYYRGLIGSRGSSIRMNGNGGSKTRMRDNTFNEKQIFEFDVK